MVLPCKSVFIMISKITELMKQVQGSHLDTGDSIEIFKREIVGKNGIITSLFNEFKSLTGSEKALVGKELNLLKNIANDKLTEAIERLSKDGDSSAPYDLTFPEHQTFKGGRHPIFLVQNKIIGIFRQLGYKVVPGPEIESDKYNFTALNFEENHPARDMQDTFFVHSNPDYVLRTHTSNIQIRVMEKQQLPIKAIAPGRVYRNETISVRAHCYFNQIEIFEVAENISFSDLKNVLVHFAEKMFGKSTKTRLRPSYFPFTEISAEMDISCLICSGNGCNVCKHTGWVEVLGSGMIDPNVLDNCGIDSTKYSGFALGMGVERIAQLLFRVPDLRLYSLNDIRFLEQFRNFS